MDVAGFDRNVELWAEEQIYALAEHDSAYAQVKWSDYTRAAFSGVAARSRVPLDIARFETADLEVEKLHLKWIIAYSGKEAAEKVLAVWAWTEFLPKEMLLLSTDAEAERAMQRASEVQYGLSVPPVREVMRLCFPDVEDGCTLHLYSRGSEGNFAYSMSNGSCIGAIHESVDDFLLDEWAVGVFEFMEAFYRFVQEMPS